MATVNTNLLVILLIILIVFNEIICDKIPTLTTPSGKISGIYETSYEGRIISSFYGVPYAKPPIQNLRFEHPQLLKEWNGTWNATTKGIECAQVSYNPIKDPKGFYKGNEDCLYLNIHVPRKQPSSKDLLNVIVYIHGGAFCSGSNNETPKILMDRDIVLVSVNYRLGLLGFLSTEDEALPGNLGLKDQAVALRWVRTNIRSFGGDPNSITLAGLSAGGASVHFHYFSPLSEGLFHKGISMSGTVFGPTKIQEAAAEKARTVGRHIGCTQEDSKEMVECMKTRPIKQVVEAIRILRPWLYYPYSPVGVVIEKDGPNGFLVEHPWTILLAGKHHDLPWLNSATSEEGLWPGIELLLKPEYLQTLKNRWNELLPFILDYYYTAPKEKHDEISESIKREYLGDKVVSKESFTNIISMYSDRLFTLCAEKASKMHSYVSKSDIYHYYFTYGGENLLRTSEMLIGRHKSFGVGHGEDTDFLFLNDPTQKLSENNEKMKNLLLDVWFSFASTSKPIIVNNVEWTPVLKNMQKPLQYLHINSPTELFMENAEVDRHEKFWNNLPIMEDDKFVNIQHIHSEL